MSDIESDFVIDFAVQQAGGIISFCKSANIHATSVILCLPMNEFMNFEKFFVVVMVIDEHFLRTLL